MKKFLTIFFVTLGVIFFILLLIGAYLFITDPWGLKPLLLGEEKIENSDTATPSRNSNPLLSDEQEQALRNIGVDPASLPSEISEEQLRCFEGVLGTERVNEIKAGATPTPVEFFRAQGCL